jgi:hypothetical protein
VAVLATAPPTDETGSDATSDGVDRFVVVPGGQRPLLMPAWVQRIRAALANPRTPASIVRAWAVSSNAMAVGSMRSGCDPNGKEYSRRSTPSARPRPRGVRACRRNMGGWVDPRRAAIPLATVANEWLTSDPTKRGGSVARDRSIVERHVVPVIGSKPVGAVTRTDIQRLAKAWVGQYAPSTVARMYSCLRAIFSYAEANELIVRTPCRNIRLPQADPRVAQIFEGDDLHRLSEAMGPDGPMVYLAAFGLRWGEVAGLRVRRVDFLRHTVRVVSQRTRGKNGRMVEQDPKTNSSRRTFAVPEWMISMLAQQLKARGLTGHDDDACSSSLPKATRSTTATGAAGCGSPRSRLPDWS